MVKILHSAWPNFVKCVQCPPYLVVKEDGHENHHTNKEESFSLADLDLHHYQASLDDNDVSKLSLFEWQKFFFILFFQKSFARDFSYGGYFLNFSSRDAKKMIRCSAPWALVPQTRSRVWSGDEAGNHIGPKSIKNV